MNGPLESFALYWVSAFSLGVGVTIWAIKSPIGGAIVVACSIGLLVIARREHARENEAGWDQ